MVLLWYSFKVIELGIKFYSNSGIWIIIILRQSFLSLNNNNVKAIFLYLLMHNCICFQHMKVVILVLAKQVENSLVLCGLNLYHCIKYLHSSANICIYIIIFIEFQMILLILYLEIQHQIEEVIWKFGGDSFIPSLSSLFVPSPSLTVLLLCFSILFLKRTCLK